MKKANYISKTPFLLECGEQLASLQLAYTTYGKINEDKSNVVWVCHALTANSEVLDWWKGLFGIGDLFNPKEHFIICVNALASSYGSSSPLSINPVSNNPYFLDFPSVTTRDMAKAHLSLAEHLGINSIEVLIGGSLGGQQALEMALLPKIRIKQLILLATNAQHSPWGIAFNESQRLAIENDPTFTNKTALGGHNGLKTARSIALLSYRTARVYNKTQQEENDIKTDNYLASSYQRYQGNKLAERFNAYSYWYLTKAMDSHHIGRNRGSIEETLGGITAQTFVIGIDSDLLFPIEEQKRIAKYIPNAQFATLHSIYGHDAFLIEIEQLKNLILKWRIELS